MRAILLALAILLLSDASQVVEHLYDATGNSDGGPTLDPNGAPRQNGDGGPTLDPNG